MKTNFIPTAVRLRILAEQVDKCKDELDLSHRVCECCDNVYFLNWKQKKLHERIEGVVERINSIASMLERRNDDPEFNPERPDGNQDRPQRTGAPPAKGRPATFEEAFGFKEDWPGQS